MATMSELGASFRAQTELECLSARLCELVYVTMREQGLDSDRLSAMTGVDKLTVGNLLRGELRAASGVQVAVASLLGMGKRVHVELRDVGQ